MGLHLLDYLQFEDLAELCQQDNRWSFLCVIAPSGCRLPVPVNPIGILSSCRAWRRELLVVAHSRSDEPSSYACTVGAEVVESRFRGTSALTLTSGDLVATFLPDVGMTGVSLQYRGAEHLALPGGLAALRAGATLGIPLLAPWANRLATRAVSGRPCRRRPERPRPHDRRQRTPDATVCSSESPAGGSSVAAPGATPHGSAPPWTWTPRRSRSRTGSRCRSPHATPG